MLQLLGVLCLNSCAPSSSTDVGNWPSSRCLASYRLGLQPEQPAVLTQRNLPAGSRPSQSSNPHPIITASFGSDLTLMRLGSVIERQSRNMTKCRGSSTCSHSSAVWNVSKTKSSRWFFLAHGQYGLATSPKWTRHSPYTASRRRGRVESKSPRRIQHSCHARIFP
jgi:hypothetical protein